MAGSQQYSLEKMHWEQDPTERALVRFEKATNEFKRRLKENQGVPLSDAKKKEIDNDLNLQLLAMKQIGDLESKLAEFRDKHQTLTGKKRREEWLKHSSKRLGDNMMLAGMPKPDKTFQAHHMIASIDPNAFDLRIMLFLAGIKQDDAKNGCWLVNWEKNHASWAYPKAICHAWLNNKGYHKWLYDDVFRGLVKQAKETDGREVTTRLSELRGDLLSGDVPLKAIKKKDKKEGL